jgi:hypothetical protein
VLTALKVPSSCFAKQFWINAGMDSHAITLHTAPKVFHFLIPVVGAFLSVFHNRKHKKDTFSMHF